MTRKFTPHGAGLGAAFRDNGKRIKHLPPISELAEAIRSGRDLADLARDFSVASSTLAYLLNKGGWSIDGEVQTFDRPPKRTPVVKFLADFPDWLDEALCSQTNPEDFFPEYGGGTSAFQTCAKCPVVDQCLKAALREEEGLPVAHRYGIRGGTTPEQRFKMQAGAA